MTVAAEIAKLRIFYLSFYLGAGVMVVILQMGTLILIVHMKIKVKIVNK